MSLEPAPPPGFPLIPAVTLESPCCDRFDCGRAMGPPQRKGVFRAATSRLLHSIDNPSVQLAIAKWAAVARQRGGGLIATCWSLSLETGGASLKKRADAFLVVRAV